MRLLTGSIVIVVLCIVAFSWQATAQYKLAGGVIAGGGGTTAGSVNRISATIGQALAGSTGGALNKAWLGFWFARTSPVTEVKLVEQTVPVTFRLEQNFPNPLNPTTTIRYTLPGRTHVILTVFNTLGEKVVDLVNDNLEAGFHEASLNAGNLASGVYFYRLTAGSFTDTRRMLILK